MNNTGVHLTSILRKILGDESTIPIHHELSTVSLGVRNLDNVHFAILRNFMELLARETGNIVRVVNNGSDTEPETITIQCFEDKAIQSLSELTEKLDKRISEQTPKAFAKQVEILGKGYPTEMTPHFEFNETGHLMFGVRANFRESCLVPVELAKVSLRHQTLRVEDKGIVIAIGTAAMGTVEAFMERSNAVHTKLLNQNATDRREAEPTVLDKLFAEAEQEGMFRSRRTRGSETPSSLKA